MDFQQRYNRQYRDRQFKGSFDLLELKLQESVTVYVGNLSFYSTEEQLYSLFDFAGPVKTVIMGLNKMEKTPCGFCFVEYHNRLCAENAVQYLTGSLLDGRQIRVDHDAGFEEGRQYGRGKSGGQIRDEKRRSYDEDRGGYSKLMQTN